MSHRDILANRAARPSTPVPGHWLLDLPTLTAKLHIRRYQDHSSQPSFGNGKTVLEGLRTAPLEKAWREINASGDGDARGLLGGWCCTTTTESDVGELWCFVVRDDAEDIPLLVVNGLDGELFPTFNRSG